MPKTPKPRKKGPKFYAVKVGRKPGVYDNWADAEAQVKGFPGAVHQSFGTEEDAKSYAKHLPNGSFMSGSAVYREQKENVSVKVEDVKEEKVDFEMLSSGESRASGSGSGEPQSEARAWNLDKGRDETILSEQQQGILQKIINGESYFFTGSAGTGKSVLLRAIINYFKDKGIEEHGNATVLMERKWEEYIQAGSRGTAPAHTSVRRWQLGVTASTGMAGVNIGGSTVHSWAGIGLGKLSAEQLAANIMKNEITHRRWKQTGALIIDEISMVDGALFDKLEHIGRIVRESKKPFGGLQIIVCGDFFQLPPISRPNEPDYKFAFESKAWPKVFPRENMSGLTRVFRQKDDEFVRILERMRKGIISPADTRSLKRCDRKVIYADGIEPVGLYPSKVEVNNINTARLAALTTPLQQYISSDVAGTNSKGYRLTQGEATDVLNRNTIWVEELHVKTGAMVMLVTNMQDGNLVNGSTGVVSDFMTVAEARKAQVYIPSRGEAACATSPPETKWPVVEFIRSRYATGVHYAKTLIPQMSVDVTNAQSTPEATRHQVPLILAWALTIHKSQGQTIERVRVDLNKIFCEGQTYVAISRAVSLDSLEIRNFVPNKVMVSKRVLQWAKPMEEEQAAAEEWDNLMANYDLEHDV